MNKKLIKFIKRFFFPKELQKPMGRWRVENNNLRLNQKIDLSNEDHCGPCGQYALTKIDFKNKKIEELNKKNNEIKKKENK
jgi:hypothetical protein